MAYDKKHDQIVKLDSDKELSFEICNSSEIVSIELLAGDAEVFGVEMVQNKISIFSNSFAVLTKFGCVLKLTGTALRMKTNARNSKLHELHMRLQEYRANACENNINGPIVLVVGPTDVGKSTLTRNLMNYAVRSGNKPLFIDLDVGQSSVSIPGTLSILTADSPGDIVSGYNEDKLSVYYHGYKAPGFNMLLYFLLIDQLSKTLQYRMQCFSEIRNSGAIIDTCGWVTGQGYKVILHAAACFAVSIVFVLGDRKLYHYLSNDLPSINVVFVKKLEGVVTRNKNERGKRRDNLVHEYFYGSKVNLKPHIFQINYIDVEIVKFKCPDKLDKYMYNDPYKHISIEKVSFGYELLHHVLAVSYAESVDTNIFATSILGFVCVKDIDISNKILTILSPQPEPLPSKILIMGDIQYRDETNR